jgi:S1-C subfamily serine protease
MPVNLARSLQTVRDLRLQTGFAGCVICAACLVLAPSLGAQQPNLSPKSTTGLQGQSTYAADNDLLPEERVNIGVYKQCSRSVVHVSTRSIGPDSDSRLELRNGSGSGSILDRQGHILTNYHVIEDARRIIVGLYDGQQFDAVLVGQDPDTDIAVIRIKVPAELLTPIAWGDSEHLQVGMRVYAIGNPFGLERTMSAGMISGLNRQIPSKTGRSIRALVQVDLNLNQGNSGGPLFSTRGQVIGMNTAIISSDGDSAGVGFAIPANTLLRVVPQLIGHGKLVRGSVGIGRVYESERGLIVINTLPGGAAERAGLKGFQLVKQVSWQAGKQFEQSFYDTASADTIISIDGTAIEGADHFLALIEMHQPGEIVHLGVLRNGQHSTIPVQIGQQ